MSAVNLQELVSRISLDRDHQMRAARAALDALLGRGQRGVVLADEVGCGKTYEALYSMEKQLDGSWRISGCTLLEIPGLDA